MLTTYKKRSAAFRLERHRLEMDAGNIVIREAVVDDVKAICEIYGHYVRESVATFEEVVPTLDDMLSRFNSLKADGMPYFVAEQAAVDNSVSPVIVGYCYAGLYRTRSAYRYTLEDSIYLDPNYRARGVGSMLLRRLIDESTKRGFRQMIAVIGGSDNLGSIKLHERLGFKHKHILYSVGLKFEKWVDVVTLQLELGEGSTSIPTQNQP
ncbi:hypothetical protein PPL_01423 [Heterostelium album PN500]|uniref:N-acetyltransferase domain-containing protein n=1 Tax=Heterostelium pallidum (strain ATCC 26659 / Pp 5 / PN500) TaxID=670386 RepID=D3AZ83_HETP5|nr:hypothetical protein PPL_01423 [Heterostelium album PN500]EFA85466.1 hypothetical protein PPL_01423 [Heterostelium album PN500]|eukprot:XP_020437574.1 hypothetical protein PPL_01423 [Heterostelium album PN500]